MFAVLVDVTYQLYKHRRELVVDALVDFLCRLVFQNAEEK